MKCLNLHDLEKRFSQILQTVVGYAIAAMRQIQFNGSNGLQRRLFLNRVLDEIAACLNIAITAR